MKTVPSLALMWILLLPQSASAGPLYGTVRMGQAPAAGIPLFIACPGFSRPGQPAPRLAMDTRTDARGSFSLRVPISGRCEMRAGNGRPFEVFVSNNALRFDFEIDGAMNRVR